MCLCIFKKYFSIYLLYRLTATISITQEKIVFSTLLAKNVSIAEKLATTEEWDVLFTGDTELANNNVDNEERKPAWISTKTWLTIKR